MQHEVLYFSGTVPGLNPILLFWDKLKRLKKRKVPVTLFTKFPAKDWRKIFDEVKENEQEYLNAYEKTISAV